jgi:hypothetical protein
LDSNNKDGGAGKMLNLLFGGFSMVTIEEYQLYGGAKQEELQRLWDVLEQILREPTTELMKNFDEYT